VPEKAVPLLLAEGGLLTRLPGQGTSGITRLIADLDSARFADREKALEELDRLGELAGPALRKLLQSRPSLEARKRAEQLLQKLEAATPSGERLRGLRAIAALEFMGNTEARELLRRLSAGAAEALLTQEAKAALVRLARRLGDGP